MSHSQSLCLANTAHAPPLLLTDASPYNAQCGRDVLKQVL
jgi:hypothetical protein